MTMKQQIYTALKIATFFGTCVLSTVWFMTPAFTIASWVYLALTWMGGMTYWSIAKRADEYEEELEKSYEQMDQVSDATNVDPDQRYIELKEELTEKNK